MKGRTLVYLSILALLGVGGLLMAWDSRGAAAQEQAGWLPATSLPVGMGGGLVVCADVPGSFYLVSGLEAPLTTTDRLFRYDISTATWVELASMPAPIRLGGVTCYEGKIYVAGGWNTRIMKSFYIYDIALDSWSEGPNLKDAVWGCGLGAWDGKLYLVGGSETDVSQVTGRVDVFDIASEEWIEEGGAEAPLPAGFYASAQVGSYYYIVGGYSSADPVNSDQTQRYDMSTDTWEVGPAFTSRRALGDLAVTSTRMYMLGGDLNEGSLGDPTNLVEVLDLTAWPGGTWVDLGDPLPVANVSPATTCTEVLSAGEIWDVGGVNMLSGALTDVYYRFTEACSASEYGVTVTPESDEKLGATGETIDFTLTVTNTGSLGDEFDIALSGNLWATVAPLTTGLVDAGETAEVTVSVTIPLDALMGAEDTVGVTFTSQGDPAATATATLTTRNYVYGVEVAPASDEQSGQPGETLIYTLTVTNTGEAGDMFTITLDGNLWETVVPASTVWLESGVTEDIQVSVTIPLDALPGAVDVAEVSFTSTHYAEVTVSATLTSRTPFLIQTLPLVFKAVTEE